MPPSDCKDKILRVSRQPSGEPEIFHSLQGEGVTAGRPSVFLRLATCNLACSWCDTKYTWDWDSYENEREVVSLFVSEVEERLLRFGCPRLVITGGEPLMQQTGPAPEPGHATFSIFTGGIPTGFERVRIERATTGWTISSTGRLSPPLDVVNHRFEMRYDTNWRPLELRIDATVKGQPYSLHTTFNDNSATSRIRQAGQTSTRIDSVSAETLVLPNNLFGAYWALHRPPVGGRSRRSATGVRGATG